MKYRPLDVVTNSFLFPTARARVREKKNQQCVCESVTVIWWSRRRNSTSTFEWTGIDWDKLKQVRPKIWFFFFEKLLLRSRSTLAVVIDKHVTMGYTLLQRYLERRFWRDSPGLLLACLSFAFLVCKLINCFFFYDSLTIFSF